MSRATRFAARDPGPAARVAGFVAHLRAHGFALGLGETGLALEALTHVRAGDPEETRAALRAVCAGTHQEVLTFDRLFDAWWLDAGRVRRRIMPTQAGSPRQSGGRTAPVEPEPTGQMKPAAAPGGSGPTVEHHGKLHASDLRSLMRRDLRELVDAGDIRRAAAVAQALGMQLRDRRSRRRKAARRGAAVDFRRTMRAALASGGVPLRLSWRRRPDRPARIIALCDVSGSMLVYARPYLAFLGGLLRADPSAEAFLFHTRLIRITPALRDRDPMRALNRVTLMAEGIGGGSKIGAALDHFARSDARRCVDGRSVVIILSDGYDTDPPDHLADALQRLKRRGCRILWLNPLKGWADYAPVARGMAAALPHLDGFHAAASLEDLAALAPRLARL